MKLNFYELVKSQLDLMEKSDYCYKKSIENWTKKEQDDISTIMRNKYKITDFEECWQKLQELCQQVMQSLELQHQPHHEEK